MSNRKLFGTDGIRGKANVYPITCEIATSLGRAVTYYFQQKFSKNKKPLIIVGKDTRLSCYMIEMAFAAGVCSQGGEVILTGPLPTPAIAFITKSMRADVGVMISASHNNFADNGIKIFDPNGFKLPDEVEAEVEELILYPEKMEVKTGGGLGKAQRLREVFGRYLVHVKSGIDPEVDLEGMRIVLDCANGAGYKLGPMAFTELGAEVFPIGISPNGENINLACGSMFPEFALEKVLQFRADIGLCLDGDADRIVAIDKTGQPVDGDQLIGLLAKFLLETGKLKVGDTVVGTVMSNLGLETFLASIGLKFHRTNVGDRYIMKYMREVGAKLGGEPSGHIIFGEHSTTGDGILAGLKILEALKFYDRGLGELVKGVVLFPQVMKNIAIREKPPLENHSIIQEALAKIEEKLGDDGRVLLRYSGTESVIRIMLEGKDESVIAQLCEQLESLVREELG